MKPGWHFDDGPTKEDPRNPKGWVLGIQSPFHMVYEALDFWDFFLSESPSVARAIDISLCQHQHQHFKWIHYEDHIFIYLAHCM